MKYVLTEETIMIEERTLYRIMAFKHFGSVKAGDMGGFIEKESNLSHEGICWVRDRACVYEDARVFQDAQVCMDARVYGNAKIYGRAHIESYAQVYGYAIVRDDARIRRKAQLYDDAIISGNGSVGEHAQIYGHAHVLGDGLVCGHAQICDCAAIGDNAVVQGDSVVSGNVYLRGQTYLRGTANVKAPKDVIHLIGVGSEYAHLTAFRTADGGVSVVRGCFFGTLDEFELAVAKKHGNNQFGVEYRALIIMLHVRFEHQGAERSLGMMIAPEHPPVGYYAAHNEMRKDLE